MFASGKPHELQHRGNNNMYRQTQIVIAAMIILGIAACREEFSPKPDVTWFLSHDDSMMCARIDKKDTLIFFYTDSTKNYARLITAIKIKTQSFVSTDQAKDVDPARNKGALVTVHSKKYSYMDSLNNFPVLISIYPTFDQTGNMRLQSRFEMLFNNYLTHHRPIYKDGLPGKFILYDSLTYNNRLYRNCNYNPLALEQHLGLLILDPGGFPMLIESKREKIYIDFLRR